jgi:hypothetical protein
MQVLFKIIILFVIFIFESEKIVCFDQNMPDDDFQWVTQEDALQARINDVTSRIQNKETASSLASLCGCAATAGAAFIVSPATAGALGVVTTYVSVKTFNQYFMAHNLPEGAKIIPQCKRELEKSNKELEKCKNKLIPRRKTKPHKTIKGHGTPKS